MNLQFELQNLAFLAAAFVLLYIAKLVQDSFVKSRFDADDQITEKSNLALALRRGGMYLGLAFGLKGALTGASKGFALDITTFALDGVLLIVLLGIAKVLADKLVLSKIDNSKEVLEGNVSVGAAEAGLFIATGLIASGSFTGASPSIQAGILSAAVFFALGQVALIVFSVVVEWIIRFDIKAEIGRGNPAAGVLLGASMVALGLILSRAISGESLGWSRDLASFGYEAAKGLIVLSVFGKLADWAFLPGTDIALEAKRDRNSAAILLHSSVLISIALLAITAFL